MTRIGQKELQALRTALASRDESGLLDAEQVIQDFVRLEPGARVYYSEGDGRVSLLVPVRDEYLGLERVPFAPSRNLANVIHEAKVEKKELELPGIGRFYQVIFSPLFDLKGKAQAAAEGGPVEVAFQGTGPGGVWSAFSREEAWFKDDLATLISLSMEGGFRVGPELRGPGWKRTTGPTFSELEKRTARPVAGHQELAQGAIHGAELVTARPIPVSQPLPEARTDFEPEELKVWPGEWSLPALEAHFPKLRTEADAVVLIGERGQEIRLEREVVAEISSWRLGQKELRPLLDADPRTLERLVQALEPFAAENAAHPLLALWRAERDQGDGGVVADALGAARELLVQKNARREAQQALHKAAFKKSFKPSGGVQ